MDGLFGTALSFWQWIQLLTSPLILVGLWSFFKELDKRGAFSPQYFTGASKYVLIGALLFFCFMIAKHQYEFTGFWAVLGNLLFYPFIRLVVRLSDAWENLNFVKARNRPPPEPVPTFDPAPPAQEVATEIIEPLRLYAYNKGKILRPTVEIEIHNFITSFYNSELSWPPASASTQPALKLFKEKMSEALRIYVAALPSGNSPFRLPYAAATDIASIYTDMENTLYTYPYKAEDNHGLFADYFKEVEKRRWAITRQHLTEKQIAEKKMRIYHNTYPGTRVEMVKAYCSGTPFYDLFMEDVPYPLPDATRLEHQFALLPSGTGKTQLIQAQIAADLEKVQEGEASIIIIDSQGLNRRDTDKPTLVENVIGLKLFAKGEPLDGKLTYIKPSIDLGLNLFDAGQNDPKLTDEERRIRLVSVREIVAMTLGGATDLQYQMLRWCVRLVMLTDSPTIHTLRRVLTTKEKDFPRVFQKELAKANTATKNYFDSFFDGTRSQSKQALVTRIDGFIEDDFFLAMIEKPTNEIKLIDQIEAGNVVVINADKVLLGDFGAEGFGRFFMAQLLFASRQRKSTKPVYVYMDEAHDFVSNDENVAKMLTQVRKWDIGFIFATQNLININSNKVKENLRDVAIYIDRVKGQPKLTFNMHLRTKEEPVEIHVRLRTMEDMKRMTPEEFAEVHKPKPLQQLIPQVLKPPTNDDEPDDVV